MAEKKVQIDIVIESANAANSLKDIKQSLKDVNNELLKTEEGTAEYNKLASAAGKLKDKIGDLNDTLKTTQGSGFEKFKNSLSLVREGFTNLDPGKLKTGIQGATQAFGGLGKAIAATGIGLLVVGIVKLIQNFDELKKVGGLVGKVFTAIGDTINFIIDGLKEFSDTIGLTNFALAEATEAEEKYGQAIAETNQQIGEQRRKQLVLTGKLSEEEAARQNLKEKFVTDFLKIQAEARQKIEEDSSEAGKKKIEEERQAKIKLLQETYVSEVLTIKKGEKDKADAQAKAQSDAAKKLAEDKKKLEEEFSGENELERLNRQEKEKLAEAKRVRASEETFLNIRQEFFNRRLKLADDSEKKLETITTDALKGGVQTINSITSQVQPITIDVITATAEEKLQAFAEKLSTALTDYGQRTIDIFGQIGSIVADNRAADLELEATNLETDYQRKKEYIERNIQDETQRAIALNNLDVQINNSRNEIERRRIELEKKAIKRERNLAIAEIALSTAIAISKAVAATSKTDPVTFALSLAANVAGVIATIAKANSALKQADAAYGAIGAGGGGGAAPLPSAATSTPSAQTPNAFALFGTGANANNLGQGQIPQLIQAYVVESDVTGVQRRVERFRTASEL